MKEAYHNKKRHDVSTMRPFPSCAAANSLASYDFSINLYEQNIPQSNSAQEIHKTSHHFSLHKMNQLLSSI
jgi:hypothetical protein